MGSVLQRLQHGNVQKMRERYIREEDYRIFRLCNIDDRVVTEMITIMNRIDKKRVGTVSITDFYHYCGYDTKYVVPMAKRIFKAFDHQLKGRLRFIDFLIVIYNYCVATEEDIINFIFDVYHQTLSAKNDDEGQRDARGESMRCLSIPILEILLREGFGTKKIDKNTKELLRWLKAKSRLKQKLSKSEFKDYVFANRRVQGFWPCFVLQRCLKTRVLGDRYWLNLAFGPTGLPRPPGVSVEMGLLCGTFVQNTLDAADPSKDRALMKKERKLREQAKASRSYTGKGSKGKKKFKL